MKVWIDLLDLLFGGAAIFIVAWVFGFVVGLRKRKKK